MRMVLKIKGLPIYISVMNDSLVEIFKRNFDFSKCVWSTCRIVKESFSLSFVLLDSLFSLLIIDLSLLIIAQNLICSLCIEICFCCLYISYNKLNLLEIKPGFREGAFFRIILSYSAFICSEEACGSRLNIL